jgi:hypothetical protein
MSNGIVKAFNKWHRAGKSRKQNTCHSECPPSDGDECSDSRYEYFVALDLQLLQIQNQNKLRGLSLRANYTERPPLVGDVSANFYG